MQMRRCTTIVTRLARSFYAQGALEFQLLLDDVLIFHGVLRKAPKKPAAGMPAADFCHSVVFTNHPAVVASEGGRVYRHAGGVEMVCGACAGARCNSADVSLSSSNQSLRLILALQVLMDGPRRMALGASDSMVNMASKQRGSGEQSSVVGRARPETGGTLGTGPL